MTDKPINRVELKKCERQWIWRKREMLGAALFHQMKPALTYGNLYSIPAHNASTCALTKRGVSGEKSTLHRSSFRFELVPMTAYINPNSLEPAQAELDPEDEVNNTSNPLNWSCDVFSTGTPQTHPHTKGNE